MNASTCHSQANEIEMSLPEHWESATDGYFTSDEMIEAYLKGRRDAMTEMDKVRSEKLKANLIVTTQVAEDIIRFMNDNKIQFTAARIRPNSITAFDIAFLIPSQVYFDDKVDVAYEYAHSATMRASTETCSIGYYFFPATQTIDQNLMASDGFIYYYDQTAAKPVPTSGAAQ